MGILDFEGVLARRICSSMWADNFWPTPGGTWHPSLRVCGGQVPTSLKEKCDLSINTMSGCHRFSFEEKSKILGYPVNRQGKAHDAIEERMQSSNKAFWKDILIYRSKDIPWKIKCRRPVDHVCAVFSFGSETWSWTMLTFESIKGWRLRLCFVFSGTKDEKKKHGSTVMQEPAKRPEKHGYRLNCLFFSK